MDELIKYITENWNNLPKSSFDDYEVVIFHEMENWDGGFGHHTYAGYGIDKDGKILYCYSSGCSCYGSAYVENEKDLKIFEVTEPDKIIITDPTKINFKDLEVYYTSY